MVSSSEPDVASQPAIHSLGNVTRISANSSVPTPGTVNTTSSPLKATSASRGPWPQARTLATGLTDSPAGTGRCRLQITFWDSTSHPSETNFQ